MRRKVGHQPAVHALTTIRQAESFSLLPVAEQSFSRACEQFARYDDQQISFVDHTSAVLAANHDTEYLFTFDSSDFHTLGFTVVPDDTGEA